MQKGNNEKKSGCSEELTEIGLTIFLAIICFEQILTWFANSLLSCVIEAV